jgi:hypothetical protein
MTASEELVIIEKRIPEQKAYITQHHREWLHLSESFTTPVGDARMLRLKKEILPSAKGVLRRLKGRKQLLIELINLLEVK